MDKCELTHEQVKALVDGKNVRVQYRTIVGYEGYGGLDMLELIPPGDKKNEDNCSRS